ncbi:hypothetical protein BGZ54_006481 [Gamsiella multidivaricata]|nr:hypothetical protein BGZ54_006481 [Gamsiella multidivaricata]
MPVPVECRAISSLEGRQDNKVSASEIAHCVQSLGRVPQLWTSYSGYFREVRVMCLAVRYSLEHDDLRSLQRNLTQSHVDQIKLLREQRRELEETHRVETTRLKEILDLHSTISQEVNSMLSSAGAVRNTLGTIFDDVSNIVRHSKEGAAQQSNALTSLQEMNGQILKAYQGSMEETLRFMSQAIRRWHEDSMSSESLDGVVSHIGEVKGYLEDLRTAAFNGTWSLVNIQDTAAKEMNLTTQASLSNLIATLDALESHSQVSWHHMMDSLRAGSTKLHAEVSTAMEETMSDIGHMATTSQEKIEELNRMVNEFQTKQGDVLWQLQTIHGTWRFLTGAAVERMSIVELAASVAILGAVFLISGIRAALLSILASIGCERLPFRMSFLQGLLTVISLKICAHTVRRYRPSEASSKGQQARESDVVMRGNLVQHIDCAHEGDVFDNEISVYDPPPRYSQEVGTLIHRQVTLQDRDRNEYTYMLTDLPAELYDDDIDYMGESFGLSLGSYT